MNHILIGSANIYIKKMTHKDDKVIISHQNLLDLGVPEMIEGDGALGA